MTAQIHDTFRFKDSEYSVVNMTEQIAFDPEEYGIIPSASTTACHRGFFCHYNISDRGVFLENLYINSADGEYTSIEGVLPCKKPGSDENMRYMGFCLYRGLHIKVKHTGYITVGKDLLRDYYYGNMSPPYWAYKAVKRFEFKDGDLIGITDLSEKAAKTRASVTESPCGFIGGIGSFID